MKKIIISVCFLLISLSVFAAPTKYTNLTKAKKLAGILKYASINDDVLISVDLKRVSNDKYYLEGIAQSGRIYILYINYLQKLLQYEDIFLSDNKVLIFPNPDRSSFVVLDKKEFLKVALNAKSYLRKYVGDDPLSGRSLLYDIKAINVVPYSSENNPLGDNPEGVPYHYVIELHNGEKDLLTYYDAYELLNEQRLLVATYPEIPVINTVYSITDLQFKPLELDKGGLPQFSAILTFDQDTLLTEEQIGIEIFSQKNSHGQLVYISIPNTIVKQPLVAERSIEYLNSVRLSNDNRYISRALLELRYNSLLSDIAPKISKIDKNNLLITFFYRGGVSTVADYKDKTITFDPRSKIDSKQEEELLQLLNKYQNDLAKIRDEQDIVVSAEKIETFVTALNKDVKAITDDSALSSFFALREQARELGYNRIIIFAKNTLSNKGEGIDLTEFFALLDKAEQFATDREKIESVRKLRTNF